VAPPPIEPAFQDQVEEQPGSVAHEQTTLLQNEEESFALAPVDASALRGMDYVTESSLRTVIQLARQVVNIQI
jgi:hypothetical protein